MIVRNLLIQSKREAQKYEKRRIRLMTKYKTLHLTVALKEMKNKDAPSARKIELMKQFKEYKNSQERMKKDKQHKNSKPPPPPTTTTTTGQTRKQGLPNREIKNRKTSLGYS